MRGALDKARPATAAGTEGIMTRSPGKAGAVTIDAGIAASAVRTRRTSRAEKAAIEAALVEAMGPAQAEVLIATGEAMPPARARAAPAPTAMQRALRLTETRRGRATLAALTWDTV